MRQSGQLTFPFTPKQEPSQMASLQFSSILDKPADSVEAPKPIPQGQYVAIVQGLPEQVESSQKKTPGLKFQFRITAALSEVDEDVVGKVVNHTYWLTEESAFMLTQFLENAGIELAGKTIGTATDEVPNREVVISIRHRPSPDGQRIFAEVSGTAPVES